MNDAPLSCSDVAGLLRRNIQICDERGVGAVLVPIREAEFILRVMEAADALVREYNPTSEERASGAGNGIGMRAAEDRLISVVEMGCGRALPRDY